VFSDGRGEGGGGLIRNKVLNGRFVGSYIQVRSQGAVQLGCNAPTTNLNTPAVTLQNIKDKNAGQLAKKTRDILPQPNIAPVESPGLEITRCQKCI